MADDLVMRSVYLPIDDDSELRQLAFRLKLSKSDLIRAAIASKLSEWRQAGSDAHIRDEINALNAGEASAVATETAAEGDRATRPGQSDGDGNGSEDAQDDGVAASAANQALLPHSVHRTRKAG